MYVLVLYLEEITRFSITVTSYKHRGVSSYRQFDFCSTVSTGWHYWPFVWGIHRWPVSLLTKGQQWGKGFHDVIMLEGDRRDWGGTYLIAENIRSLMWLKLSVLRLWIWQLFHGSCHERFGTKTPMDRFVVRWKMSYHKIIRRPGHKSHVSIPIQISLKFVYKIQISDIPSLVKIMTWRRPGDKPLSEPVMARLATLILIVVCEICVSSRRHR